MAQTIRRAASPVADPPFYTDRRPDFDDTPEAPLAWLLPPTPPQSDEGVLAPHPAQDGDGGNVA
jgi:hypothetical protein